MITDCGDRVRRSRTNSRNKSWAKFQRTTDPSLNVSRKPASTSLFCCQRGLGRVRKNSSKRLKWIMGMVKAKLRGLYEYFGLSGNSAILKEIYYLYRKTLYLLLNRRSQRKSFNYNRFTFVLRFYGVVPYRSRLVNKGMQLSLLPFLD